ncbi:MAG: S8 family serine peptidase [Ignavibacteria bacterium]|nr:S8 family serine peptidase [Ignavibacteria bacterium]
MTAILTVRQGAAPHVTGVVALLLSLNKELTLHQIRSTLHLSADRLPAMGDTLPHREYGWGRVKAFRALRNLYVPSVYPTVDSALRQAVPGQCVVLEAESGEHSLENWNTYPRYVEMEIEHGSTLRFTDTLSVDTTNVFRLFSNDTSRSVIRFESGAFLNVTGAGVLRGSGSIEQARIHWNTDLQIADGEELTFERGGILSFDSGRAININGSLVFDSDSSSSRIRYGQSSFHPARA